MQNKCRKFEYDPLINDNCETHNADTERGRFKANGSDTMKVHWIYKIILVLFLLTLIVYNIFDYIEILNNRKFRTTTFNQSISDNATDVLSYQRKLRNAKYYVNTSECFMPYVNPYTPAIRKIFTYYKRPLCANKVSFIKLWFNVNAQQYILHMNENEIIRFTENLRVTSLNKIQCCYQEVIRESFNSTTDDEYSLKPCKDFGQDFMVPSHIDSLVVNCVIKKSKRPFHRTVFYMVQVKNRIIQNTSSVPSEKRKPGIIMIGIDSLSRISARRSLPSTFKYLQEKPWFELQGFTKVGENTFPNLMALLTGQDLETSVRVCNPREIGGLDKCQFIWKQFKKQGYYTAYIEDNIPISTFNYLKRGFGKAPTDYYYRPTALAMEALLQTTKKRGLTYCVGNRQYGEYIYEVGIQFALRLQDKPHFGLFWTNSFSHNDYSLISSMDRNMLKYFKQMEYDGVFKNSIVMFFSDHGQRWGPLLDQPDAFIEERSPMFFIFLPLWFRNQYPDFVRHLKTNQERLTTPYDIYMTLQHILKLNNDQYKIRPAQGCAKCQSVFKEVPENRTCNQTGIPEIWCTCEPLIYIKKIDQRIKHFAQVVINVINKLLTELKVNCLCSKLALHKIEAVKKHFKEKDPTRVMFIIDFTVKPLVNTPAKFTATVFYNRQTDLVSVSSENIIRSSKYENTGKCVKNATEKKFCLCKDL